MSPRPPPLIWSAIATSPAHCGHESDVPPMSYQPVRPTLLPLPSGGSARYTSAPVPELAWKATSGTPRIDPIVVLPTGSTFCHEGFAKTWLKPPPENVQAISALTPPGLKNALPHFAPMPGFLKFARG